MSPQQNLECRRYEIIWISGRTNVKKKGVLRVVPTALIINLDDSYGWLISHPNKLFVPQALGLINHGIANVFHERKCFRSYEFDIIKPIFDIFMLRNSKYCGSLFSLTALSLEK